MMLKDLSTAGWTCRYVCTPLVKEFVLVGCRASVTVVKWWRRPQEVMCILRWMLNISNWLSFRRNSQPQGCGYDEWGIAFLQYVQGSLRAAAGTIAILQVGLRAVAQPPRLLSWCVYPTAAFLSGRFTHNTLTLLCWWLTLYNNSI
jgi:hypothetical protein